MDLKTRKGVKRLGIILIALLVLAGGYFVVMPLIDQQSEYQEKIAAAESEQQSTYMQLVQTQAKVAQTVNVEKFDKELSTAFPGRVTTPEIIALINQAASAAGIAPDAIESLMAGIPTLVTNTGETGGVAMPPIATSGASGEAAAAPTPDTVASSNTAEVSISFTVKATLPQINAFVKNLLANERNLFIMDYSVSSTDKGSSASFTVKSYIYNPIPAIAETPTEQPTQPGNDEDEVSVPLPEEFRDQ